MSSDKCSKQNCLSQSKPVRVELANSRLIVWNPEEGSALYANGFFGKPLGIRKPKNAEFDKPLELSFLEAKYLLELGLIEIFSNTTDTGKSTDECTTTSSEEPSTSAQSIKEKLKLEEFTTIANKCFEELFEEKYLVYKYLRDNGYVVRPGLKFGAAFAVYEKGPGLEHSSFLVDVLPRDGKITATEMVRAGRLANNVRKQFVIATIGADGEARFYEFDWFKP